MDWIQIVLSDEARFRGELSAGDPAIPQDLKEVVAETGSQVLVLARTDHFLWMAYQSSFKKVDVKRIREISMVNRTPARGAGFIAITLATRFGKFHSEIVDYDRHTDELFDEAKALAEATGKFLGCKIKFTCGGTDC